MEFYLKILWEKGLIMNRIFRSDNWICVHLNPIWHDKANFIIRTYLEERGGRHRWEQLWTRQLDENRFLICCIPFFAYNLALGDEVGTDVHHTIIRVVKHSENSTFRVWFGNAVNPEEVKSEVLYELRRFSIDYEWHSKNLLAVSVSAEDLAKAVSGFFLERQAEGKLQYETGRTH